METRLPRFLWITAKDKSHYPERQVALARAIAKDRTDTAAGLLKSGASVSMKDPDGLNAMGYLARYGKSGKMLSLLIDAGAKLESPAKGGLTPLMLAAGYDNEEMTRLLLENGANINCHAENGMSLFIVSLSISAGARTVKALLEHGADPNDKDPEGVTALMYSTGLGVEVFQLLIAQGADANAATPEGINAYMYALECDDPVPFLEALTEADADINQKDALGLTPLMLAAADDSKAGALAYLISDGADVNAKARDGRTALMTACQFTFQPGTVQRLLDAGADALAEDENSKTAYDYIPQDSPLLEEEDIISLLMPED